MNEENEAATEERTDEITTEEQPKADTSPEAADEDKPKAKPGRKPKSVDADKPKAKPAPSIPASGNVDKNRDYKPGTTHILDDGTTIRDA